MFSPTHLIDIASVVHTSFMVRCDHLVQTNVNMASERNIIKLPTISTLKSVTPPYQISRGDRLGSAPQQCVTEGGRRGGRIQ